MRNLKNLIGESLKTNGETWDDVISTTLSELELEGPRKFCPFSGNGTPFYLWTENRVYFSVSWGEWEENSDYVASVPRNVTKDPPSSSV